MNDLSLLVDAQRQVAERVRDPEILRALADRAPLQKLKRYLKEAHRRQSAGLPLPDLTPAAEPETAGPGEPALDRFAALGPPPADPLEAQEWNYRVALEAVYEVANDGRLAAGKRREQLVRAQRVAVAAAPHAELDAARRALKRDADQVDEDDGDPEMEDRGGDQKSLRAPSH